MRILLYATLGGLVCLSLPMATMAAKYQQTATPAPVEQDVEAVATVNQMRVFIDPETGKRVSRPVTVEQQRAAETGMDMRQAGPVEEIRHPNGMIEYVLNGAADSFLTISVDKNGQRHSQCTDPTHQHTAVPGASQTEVAHER